MGPAHLWWWKSVGKTCGKKARPGISAKKSIAAKKAATKQSSSCCQRCCHTPCITKISTRKYQVFLPDVIGKGNPSKADEFSEKFQTAVDPAPLIFRKSCCGFFIRLYSLKNHTCGIFLKSPGYESIKNDDPWCQIQCLNFKFWGWLGKKLLRLESRYPESFRFLCPWGCQCYKLYKTIQNFAIRLWRSCADGYSRSWELWGGFPKHRRGRIQILLQAIVHPSPESRVCSENSPFAPFWIRNAPI